MSLLELLVFVPVWGLLCVERSDSGFSATSHAWKCPRGTKNDGWAKDRFPPLKRANRRSGGSSRIHELNLKTGRKESPYLPVTGCSVISYFSLMKDVSPEATAVHSWRDLTAFCTAQPSFPHINEGANLHVQIMEKKKDLKNFSFLL